MSLSVIRILMLGLLLTPAICCAAESDADQAKAMAEIHRMLGRFKVDEKRPGRPVIEIRFEMRDPDDPKVTDDSLRHLKVFKELRVLQLRYTDITDAGLVHVEALPKLQELHLDNTEVADAGLAHLKGLSELRRLSLEQVSGVTDAGLVHLKGLKNLDWLNLGWTNVTDSGLVHLEGLTKLKTLDLERTSVSDVGVKRPQKALPNCKIRLSR